MSIFVDIILSFIGWFLMYLGMCALDQIYKSGNYNFWYIKPEKWLENAGLYWMIIFFLLLLI